MKRGALAEKQMIEWLRCRERLFWANPGWQSAAACLPGLPYSMAEVLDAQARWQRFAPLLAECFPELEASQGMIESPLLPAESLAARILPPESGRLWIKADHALPVAGSIKARGGIYAVLHAAESIARQQGLLKTGEEDYRALATARARRLFNTYTLSVGSTGNLGLSIGMAGSALGFKVTVHMSSEAKAWKKDRLRQRGVQVVEHATDYTAACATARAEAARHTHMHFIDDENSRELFFGYAAAVPRLKEQLAAQGATVDREHPLFLYLPCGVGGAPGGITFAARHVFGDGVHAFFIEPVEAPCMLLGLLTGKHAGVSVARLGLTLKTEADGLAVSTPSRFVGQLMAPLLSGCMTLDDRTLGRHLLDLFEAEGMEVEPSAAAGCAGPGMLCESSAGKAWLEERGLRPYLSRAQHIVWTTGGALVPQAQHEHFRAQSVSHAGDAPAASTSST